MKLTKEDKQFSREWVDRLIHQTDFGATMPTVPYYWEHGMWFGTHESRNILDKVDTTEEWKAEIMMAISKRNVILMKDASANQQIMNKAWIMGLKTVLGYIECIELLGGM